MKKNIPHEDWHEHLNKIGLGNFDVLGSYTGVPEEPEEIPVQDADDL